MELQLREFDRCRKLYEKYLEFTPENCTTWIKFAELETILGDVYRARAIFELAIGQPRLDMPEVPPPSLKTETLTQTEPDRNKSRLILMLTNTIDGLTNASVHVVVIFKSVLNVLQVLWKSYIDFEIEQEEFGNTRNLYKRLLQRTQHVKVSPVAPCATSGRTNRTCRPTGLSGGRFGSATPSSSCRWKVASGSAGAGRSSRRPTRA